ncbi:Glucoamylase [Acidisarcina polymorpha]|uniref:Trehalase n=1 Tax=Acidisarcina polymorpha TaxID=2211140 RepID=A0A2Z5FYR5_9BACT|nr:glycoside hydrolase family 15 protein [Acidisarcina polymorpha]AXC12019.1 Glucoamylase [Acidisarcina polymorpha]
MLIEEYALIGDGRTAALVGRDGSIDWLCWPTFASAACFAKLLGSEQNGFWKLAPTNPKWKVARRYQPHTLILETCFETSTGSVQVLDYMPVRSAHSQIIRTVKGLSGRVKMLGVLALRFDNGSAVPWVTRTKLGMRAVAGPDAVELQTNAPLEGKSLRTASEFIVGQGESVDFVLTYKGFDGYRARSSGAPVHVQKAYDETRRLWTTWAEKCAYDGPHREMVVRSLITLKALIYRPTGAIVAAPTTSLPEAMGGTRNWDYRYCWLRDTTFTLLVLINSGYKQEARDWMDWLQRSVAGSPEQIQIMYGISGERTLLEYEVSLPGYENSAPVRIGNAAAQQLQLDTYGEVLDAFFWTYASLGDRNRSRDFRLLRRIVEHLETLWEQADEGIWEVRGGPQHFTYSKVMTWVAFDRAIKIAEKVSFETPVKRWRQIRDTIHAEVCTREFDPSQNSFVQHYETKQLDASALLIALVGFLPPQDPRVLGTISAIEGKLMEGGLVMRYDNRESNDGLPDEEGKFLACSFWLVSNLKLIGRDEDARKLFENLLKLANETGLLSEEYDTARKRLVGNFPQAFSHIALVGAAYHLADAGKQRQQASVARNTGLKPSTAVRLKGRRKAAGLVLREAQGLSNTAHPEPSSKEE